MHPYNKVLARYYKAEKWLEENKEQADRFIGEFHSIMAELNRLIQEYGIKEDEILGGVK